MATPSAAEDQGASSQQAYVQAVTGQPLAVTVCPLLEIKKGPSGERGVFATADIPANTTLVQVPFASLLTLESLRSTPALSPVLRADPPLREDDALAILLLYERGRGNASKWAPHIRILPTRVDCALNFSPGMLKRLGHSQLGLLAQQLQRQTRQDYAEVSRRPGLVLGDDGQGPGRTLLECRGWWSWDGYVWALSMIHSRFVSVAANNKPGPLKAMAPYFDLLNHSSDEPPSLAHSVAPARNALVVTSTTTLPAGHEVCLNYGPHSPLKLLMLYGFLPPAATDTYNAELDRYAAIDLYIGTDPAARGYRGKAHALATLGLPLSGAHSVTSAAPHIPPGLLATLRIQRAATPEEMGRLALALKGPLSPENEQAALGALRGALEAMLGALPSPQGSAPPPTKDAALLGMVDRYIESERRVLEKAVAKVVELEGQITS